MTVEIETAWALEQRLAREGAGRLAIREALRATAPARHADRVERVLARLRHCMGEPQGCPLGQLAGTPAVAALAGELLGLGGPLGLSGDATARGPILGSLGKGRRQVSDGGAWTAAAAAALERLLEAGLSGEVDPSNVTDPLLFAPHAIVLARLAIIRAAKAPCRTLPIGVTFASATFPAWEAALRQAAGREMCRTATAVRMGTLPEALAPGADQCGLCGSAAAATITHGSWDAAWVASAGLASPAKPSLECAVCAVCGGGHDKLAALRDELMPAPPVPAEAEA